MMRKQPGWYELVDRRLFRDAKVRGWGPTKPHPLVLWCYLLACPFGTPLRGVLCCSVGAIADDLRWPVPATRKALETLQRDGMVRLDLDAGLVWIVNRLRYSPPESPSVVVGWRNYWPTVPECALRDEIDAAFSSQLGELGPSFARAWETACGRAGPPPATNPAGFPAAMRAAGQAAAVADTGPGPHPAPQPAVDPGPHPAPQPAVDPGPHRERERENTPTRVRAPAPAPAREADPDQEPSWGEAVDVLASASGGRISAMGGEALLFAAMGSLWMRHRVGVADYRLVGEWASRSGGDGLRWMRTAVSPSRLAASDGALLGECVEKARAWRDAGKPCPDPAVAAPSGARRQTIEPVAQSFALTGDDPLRGLTGERR